MKFTIALVLTLLLAFISGLFLPWWGIAIVAFLVAFLVKQVSGLAFLSAFTALLLLWAGMAWWIDMKNNAVLSHRIANVIPLGGNSMLLILVTGLLGGIVAGFAAMSGSQLRKIISPS